MAYYGLEMITVW